MSVSSEQCFQWRYKLTCSTEALSVVAAYRFVTEPLSWH